MEFSARPHLHVVVTGAPELDRYEFVPDIEPGDDVRLRSFVPGRSIADNCFSIARPLFGRGRGEWVLCLARELVIRRPDIDRGKQRRGWVAAILLAAAVDDGLRGNAAVWRDVVDDVTYASGVSAVTALRRLDELIAGGLCRPLDPPAYWA